MQLEVLDVSPLSPFLSFLGPEIPQEINLPSSAMALELFSIWPVPNEVFRIALVPPKTRICTFFAAFMRGF